MITSQALKSLCLESSSSKTALWEHMVRPLGWEGFLDMSDILSAFCLCGLGTIFNLSLCHSDLPSRALIIFVSLLQLLSPTWRLSYWCWNARNSRTMPAPQRLAKWTWRSLRPLRWTNMRQEWSDKFFFFLCLVRLLWESGICKPFQKLFLFLFFF